MTKEEIQNKILKCFSNSFYGDFRQEYDLWKIIKDLQKAGLFPSDTRLKKYDFEKQKWKN